MTRGLGANFAFECDDKAREASVQAKGGLRQLAGDPGLIGDTLNGLRGLTQSSRMDVSA